MSLQHPSLENLLYHLPKVELHRHLEGSIPIPLVLQWSQKYNLLYENKREDLQVKKPMPLNLVLNRLLYQNRCFQNTHSIETLTYEVLKEISKDNIKLIELRFSPGFMSQPAHLSFNSIMEATLTAKERAEKDFGIEIGFLLISSRDFGIDVCEETIDLAIRWKKEIIGIDLAGAEEDFPPELFEKPFQRAHQAGLAITAHSGEVSDPKHILTSIKKLKAKRIGHGVQAITSLDVISELKKHHIPLELCPTSNVMTQAVPSIREHPIKKLMKAGVPVTINSDDPTLFDTTLSNEYKTCVENLDFSIQEIKKTILTAFHHSFLPQEKKKRAWDQHFKFF